MDIWWCTCSHLQYTWHHCSIVGMCHHYLDNTVCLLESLRWFNSRWWRIELWLAWHLLSLCWIDCRWWCNICCLCKCRSILLDLQRMWALLLPLVRLCSCLWLLWIGWTLLPLGYRTLVRIWIGLLLLPLLLGLSMTARSLKI